MVPLDGLGEALLHADRHRLTLRQVRYHACVTSRNQDFSKLRCPPCIPFLESKTCCRTAPRRGALLSRALRERKTCTAKNTGARATANITNQHIQNASPSSKAPQDARPRNTEPLKVPMRCREKHARGSLAAWRGGRRGVRVGTSGGARTLVNGSGKCVRLPDGSAPSQTQRLRRAACVVVAAGRLKWEPEGAGKEDSRLGSALTGKERSRGTGRGARARRGAARARSSILDWARALRRGRDE